MASADPPLAVHGLYGSRDREHHCHCTEEVHRLGGPLGGDPASVAVCHGSVLVRTAVCQQVAQRAKHRLNPRPAALSEAGSVPASWLVLAGAWAITTSIRTLWDNQSRWKTQRMPEECLVTTLRHSERHSCSLFSD